MCFLQHSHADSTPTLKSFSDPVVTSAFPSIWQKACAFACLMETPALLKGQWEPKSTGLVNIHVYARMKNTGTNQSQGAVKGGQYSAFKI